MLEGGEECTEHNWTNGNIGYYPKSTQSQCAACSPDPVLEPVYPGCCPSSQRHIFYSIGPSS